MGGRCQWAISAQEQWAIRQFLLAAVARGSAQLSLKKPHYRLTHWQAAGTKMKGKEEVIVDAVEDGDKPASWSSLLSATECACPSVCVRVGDANVKVLEARAPLLFKSLAPLSPIFIHFPFPIAVPYPCLSRGHYIQHFSPYVRACAQIQLVSWRCHIGEELRPGGEVVKKGRSVGGGGSRWMASHLSSGHSFSSFLFYKNKTKNLEPRWQLREAARRHGCASS